MTSGRRWPTLVLSHRDPRGGMGVHRLRSADVHAALAAGTVAAGPSARIHVRVRDDGGCARWTVVAGKHVGPAVLRNLAKRRLRAALRAVTLPVGLDLVVVARPDALTRGFSELVGELERTSERAASRLAERAE